MFFGCSFALRKLVLLLMLFREKGRRAGLDICVARRREVARVGVSQRVKFSGRMDMLVL